MRELIAEILKDPRDAASLAACPMLPVPRYGRLPDLACGAVRYLAARDGLYIEARTQTMAVRACLAQVDSLPFGRIEAGIALIGGKVPKGMLDAAVECAAAALPGEWAGAILLDDGRYRLALPPVHSSSTAHVRYSAADLPTEQLVMDLHSHGRLAPFFSATDDRDDAGNPAVAFMAGVVGTVDVVPTWAWRIVLNGRAFDLGLDGGQPLVAAPVGAEPC